METLTELAGMIEDINLNEITAHIQDGTLLPWVECWKAKSRKLIEVLLENEKPRLSEKD